MFVQFDKIGNDLDFVFDVEQFQGVVLQTLGNRSHKIGFVDAESYRGFVKRMASHQGNVGSVQRGDHGEVYPFVLEHLFSHITGISVRNGIMNVQQFYFVQLDHIDQFA